MALDAKEWHERIKTLKKKPVSTRRLTEVTGNTVEEMQVNSNNSYVTEDKFNHVLQTLKIALGRCCRLQG